MSEELSPIRAAINEMDGEFLLLDRHAFDVAILGVSTAFGKNQVIYDTEKVIETLMSEHGMDRDEAEEFFDVNIAGAYLGENTPLYLYRTEDILARS